AAAKGEAVGGKAPLRADAVEAAVAQQDVAVFRGGAAETLEMRGLGREQRLGAEAQARRGGEEELVEGADEFGPQREGRMFERRRSRNREQRALLRRQVEVGK